MASLRGFLLTLVLLLTTLPPPCSSLPTTTTSFHSLISLSHSLLTRVSNLRASRGDISGSIRAKSIAQKIEKYTHGGFSFYGLIFSLSWDYLKNYSWRDVSFQMSGVVSDFKNLLMSFNEFTRLQSEIDRVQWLRTNYANLLNISNSMLNRLLDVFTHSGPLKDIVEMAKIEIMDGGLLRDSLELGIGDLKGVIQILKDVALKYSSSGKNEL